MVCCSSHPYAAAPTMRLNRLAAHWAVLGTTAVRHDEGIDVDEAMGVSLGRRASGI